jgi:hypothetical protein
MDQPQSTNIKQLFIYMNSGTADLKFFYWMGGSIIRKRGFVSFPELFTDRHENRLIKDQLAGSTCSGNFFLGIKERIMIMEIPVVI